MFLLLLPKLPSHLCSLIVFGFCRLQSEELGNGRGVWIWYRTFCKEKYY